MSTVQPFPLVDWKERGPKGNIIASYSLEDCPKASKNHFNLGIDASSGLVVLPTYTGRTPNAIYSVNRFEKKDTDGIKNLQKSTLTNFLGFLSFSFTVKVDGSKEDEYPELVIDLTVKDGETFNRLMKELEELRDSCKRKTNPNP